MSADLTRSNEPRRQMTADIADELRTPLTVVRAYVDGLLDGTFKPTPARFEAMQAETQHLQRFVEYLRTLSLADAGELPMQRVPISAGRSSNGLPPPTRPRPPRGHRFAGLG